MWLVVHIPKTGGTSFRWALEKYFGESKVIRDYGPDAKATSDVVRKYLYAGADSQGPAELVKAISNDSAKILVGHFSLQKYASFFEPRNIITLIRDPLVRVCSEYLHRSNNRSYKGSFTEFIQEPGLQNLQSRVLNGVSEDSIIGITEQYGESLHHINKIFQWELETVRKNVARYKGGQKLGKKLSATEMELFYRMNKKDSELYQIATQRVASLEISKPNENTIFKWLKKAMRISN